MNFKNFIFGLVISSFSAFSVCAQDKDVKFKYLENLVVNNDSTYRTIVYKNEEEGIEDMLKLVKTSKLEEAWIFLPNWNLWYEIGKTSRNYFKEGTYFSTISIDGEFRDKLIRENDNLVYYHFHPEFNSEDIYKKIFGQNIIIQGAILSHGDLIEAITSTRDFYKYHPNGKTKFSTVSGEGIIDFYMTEEGLKANKDRKKRAISLYTSFKFGWKKSFEKDDMEIGNRIKDILDSMSDDHIILRLRE